MRSSSYFVDLVELLFPVLRTEVIIWIRNFSYLIVIDGLWKMKMKKDILVRIIFKNYNVNKGQWNVHIIIYGDEMNLFSLPLSVNALIYINLTS